MNYSKSANSNRAGAKKRKRRRRKNSIGVIILRIVIILVVVGAFSLVGGALGAYMGIIGNAPKLNTLDVVPDSYTSIIYDDNNIEFDSLHGTENREYVKLADMPQDLKDAIISIEDERFYDHGGVDFRGMLRALFINLKSGEFTQGASTITQQLIKNEVLTSEKKLERKLQEQYLAVNFEKSLTETLGSKKKAKDYILELYLNTIGLNHGLNGVGSASKFYFGKEVSELSLAESAAIAGITKNPSLYSPVSHPDKNKERQKAVLAKMLELKYITESEYKSALEEDYLSQIVGSSGSSEGGTSIHNYFVDQLVVEIAGDLMTQKSMNKQQAYNMIYSGGLKIYSTIDRDMQAILEDSYKNDSLFPPKGNYLNATYTISIMDNATEEQKHYTRESQVNNMEEAEAFAQSVRAELLNSSNTMVLDKLSVAQALQSAMVITDYKTGYVKALIGGRGEKQGDLVFNRATQALRQPGSCFKVLASYAPAVDLGIVYPGSIIVDEPLTVGDHSFRNWWGDSYRGPSTVRAGIRDSMNILAVKTLMMVGYDRSFDYLLNLGFTSLVDSRKNESGKVFSDKVPSLALGGITDGVSVLELTSAYGTIANGGLYNEPVTYTKVLDHDGKVLLENKVEPKRVLKETTAYLLTDMMEDVITGGGSATGRLARFTSVKMPIAGKTGTTTDDKDLMFAGYTPYYVAGIWLGYDTPKTMNYDKSYHLLLWSDVMEKIHQNLEYKEFVRPSGIVTRTVCGVTGLAPVAGLCENDYFGNGLSTDICASDFSPGGTCNVHKIFKIDVKTGMLANEYCPEEDVKEVVLAVDENGNVMNQPASSEEDAVVIDVNHTCTFHNAETAAQEQWERENPDDGRIIIDNPGENDSGIHLPVDDDLVSSTTSDEEENEMYIPFD